MPTIDIDFSTTGNLSSPGPDGQLGTTQLYDHLGSIWSVSSNQLKNVSTSLPTAALTCNSAFSSTSPNHTVTVNINSLSVTPGDIVAALRWSSSVGNCYAIFASGTKYEQFIIRKYINGSSADLANNVWDSSGGGNFNNTQTGDHMKIVASVSDMSPGTITIKVQNVTRNFYYTLATVPYLAVTDSAYVSGQAGLISFNASAIDRLTIDVEGMTPPPTPGFGISPHHTSTVITNSSTATQIVFVPQGLSGQKSNVPITIIQNIGLTDIYFGPATVTNSGANIGAILKGGQTPPDQKTLTYCGETWAIASSGTPSVVIDQIY